MLSYVLFFLWIGRKMFSRRCRLQYRQRGHRQYVLLIFVLYSISSLTFVHWSSFRRFVRRVRTIYRWVIFAARADPRIMVGRGNANGTAVNGWAGEGPNTTNKNQLWHIVRA